MKQTITDYSHTSELYNDVAIPQKFKKDDRESYLEVSVNKNHNNFSQFYFGQTLYENQIDIVNTIINTGAQEVDVVEPRQCGKTSSIAVACAILCETQGEKWNKVNPEPYRIGIFGPKLGQAQLDLIRIKFWANNNPHGRSLINWKETTNSKIVWHNGSEIHAVSASEQTETEGFTFNIIIIEESQKVSDHTVSQVISPMTGACVCAGSLVVDDNGNRISIEYFHSKKIVGFLANKHYIDNVVWKDRTGKKQFYRITLNSGRYIDCSFDHLILIKKRMNRILKYYETKDLSCGLQIAIIDEIPLFGNREMFDARLVGMLIGDGTYGKDKQVRYCSCDKELLDYAKRHEYKTIETTATRKGKLFEQLTIYKLCNKLINLGIYGQVSKEKRLPILMDSYSKETICELLGGLFDTDGSVSLRDNRRGCIELSSISKDLIWDTFYLLDKMGIHSKVYMKKGRLKLWKNRHSGRIYSSMSKDYWRLSINEKKSIERFHKQIKFLVGYKQERLNELMKILSNHKCKRQDNMDGLYFERIVKIEDIGIKTVYNLTAEYSHTYVVNGIVTHNTGGKIVKIGTVRAIRNHFWRSCCKNPRTKKIAHHWLLCGLLLRRWGYKEYNGNRISNHILTQMPWLIKERYMMNGIFPNTPDFMYYGDMEYNDFMTQYELEWLEQFGLFLTRDELDKMFLGNHLYEYSQTSGNDELYAGIDFATGSNQDDTSVTVYKKIGNLKRKIYGTTWGDLPIPDQKRELTNLFGPSGRFHCKCILGDVGGNGQAIIEDLKSELNLPIYGVSFGSTDRDIKMVSINMKTSMYNDFKRELQNGMIQHYSISADIPKEIQMQYRKDRREWETLEQETRDDTVNKKIQAIES